jgi:hypothetical protein
MSSYATTTGETIAQAFDRFNKENPAVYALFKQYAFYLLRDKGKKKISSKLIVNRIRWERYLETTGKDYRINDAFTAHYARLFIKDFPGYGEAFELRELRS